MYDDLMNSSEYIVMFKKEKTIIFEKLFQKDCDRMKEYLMISIDGDCCFKFY
jgi:hypothetical protein